MWRNRDVQWIINGKLTKGRTNGISETDALSVVIAGRGRLVVLLLHTLEGVTDS